MKQIRKVNNLAITIIMIVILLVALSTATFAWFSASNIVNLSKMDFTISSKYGYGDLMMGWRAFDDYMTNEQRLDELYYDLPYITLWYTTLSPAMPSVKPYVGMKSSDFIDSLHTGEVVNIAGEEPRYRSNGIHVYPGIINSDRDIYINNYERWHKDFYLYNINEDFDLDVTLDVKSKSSAYEFFRIAVFVDDGLVGFVGGDNRVHYGEIKSGEEVDPDAYVSCDLTFDAKDPNGVYSNDSISFRVSTYREVKLLFYFDGMYVGDVNEYDEISIDLRFMGEYIEKE